MDLARIEEIRSKAAFPTWTEMCELLDAAKKWVELESEEDSEAWYTKKMKYAEAKVAALEAENARLTALVREAKEWFSTVCGETYPWPKEGTWEKRAEAELEGK